MAALRRYGGADGAYWIVDPDGPAEARRLVFCRSFGLSADGVLVGEVLEPGRWRLAAYSGEGQEEVPDRYQMALFARFLFDTDRGKNGAAAVETAAGGERFCAANLPAGRCLETVGEQALWDYLSL